MADVLRVVLSDVLLLFSVDCEGMHTCQNGPCIDSNFVCVIVFVFSVDCDGMHTCQNGRCIDSNFVCVIFSGL